MKPHSRVDCELIPVSLRFRRQTNRESISGSGVKLVYDQTTQSGKITELLSQLDPELRAIVGVVSACARIGLRVCLLEQRVKADQGLNQSSER